MAEASWRRACCEISSLRLVAAWVLLPLLLPFLFYFPFSYLSHGWLAVIPGMGAMALMPLLSFPLLVAKQFCIDAFWIVSSASAFFHSVLCVQGLLTSLFLLIGYGVCGLRGRGMLSKGCWTTTGVDQSGSMLRSAELRLSAFRDRALLR